MARRSSRKRTTGTRKRLTFMHPYSRRKRKVSLTVDHYERDRNGRKRAVAFDNQGNPHFQYVKEHGTHRRSYRRRRSRH